MLETILSDSGAFVKNASVSKIRKWPTLCQMCKTGLQQGRLSGILCSDAFQLKFGELKTTIENYFPIFVENQNARIRIYATFL